MIKNFSTLFPLLNYIQAFVQIMAIINWLLHTVINLIKQISVNPHIISLYFFKKSAVRRKQPFNLGPNILILSSFLPRHGTVNYN